jgi:uncharacterized membrane protein SirB2
MPLIDLYPLMRQVHLTAVALSLTLFVLRGCGVLAGAPWPMQPLARRASVVMDTVLLCAGGLLWFTLGLNPWRNPWLGTKLLLLLLYIGLGSMALKRAPGRGARAVCFLLALACAAAIVSVASAHSPGGLWPFGAG